jgi:hypothetical protein
MLVIFISQELIDALLPCGTTVYYRKPSDIAKKLLASTSAQQEMQFEWEYNNECIKHAHNADGWLDQVSYFYPLLLAGYP